MLTETLAAINKFSLTNCYLIFSSVSYYHRLHFIQKTQLFSQLSTLAFHKELSVSHPHQILTLFTKNSPFLILTKSATDNGVRNIVSPTPASTIEEKKIGKNEKEAMDSKEEVAAIGGNGFDLKNEAIDSAEAFKDPRWVKGNWDLSKFETNGKTDWDLLVIGI